MSDTPATATEAAPTEAAPTEQPATKGTPYFFSFHFSGEDSGVPKEGFDSRVVTLPEGFKVNTAAQIKEITEAMAKSIFQDGKKWVGLHLTILNVTKLPL